MLVQSVLVQGTGAAIAGSLARLVGAAAPLDALVLCSLDVQHSTLRDAVVAAAAAVRPPLESGLVTAPPCPIYLAETYGILGWDESLRRTVELMELGRGSEYGCVGGSGGQGCLVVAVSGGATAGHTPEELPASTTSCWVIADGSGAWQRQVAPHAPLHYGGIAKGCYKFEPHKNEWQPVPYVWVADAADSVGVAVVPEEQDDVGPAVAQLLQNVPSDRIASGDVGLFPCFTRGVNAYGREDVESSQIAAALPGARVFGMFAHGELGPRNFAGFPSNSGAPVPCTQHSGASIVSLHTMVE